MESALGQDFTDLELIVIDDGSKDGTPAQIARIGDPRVRYFRLERNQGIGAARSAGVDHARGTVVAFLDSDDRWTQGKLGEVVRFLELHPNVDLVFSDYEDINSIRNTRDRGFAEASEVLRRLKVVPLDAQWWMIEAGVPEGLLTANFLGTASVVALRRSVFERVGNFRTDLSGSEDIEFWWRAAVRGKAQFAYTTLVLAERNKGTDSITAGKRAFAPQRMRALDACEETARTTGRLDLLAHIRRARVRTCCDLIEACALEGRRAEALRAFWLCSRFGLSFDAMRYLLAALIGPRIVSLAKRLTGR
jgi:GT2 family glycosyltransferase